MKYIKIKYSTHFSALSILPDPCQTYFQRTIGLGSKNAAGDVKVEQTVSGSAIELGEIMRAGTNARFLC